jgi:hypothetical protein
MMGENNDMGCNNTERRLYNDFLFCFVLITCTSASSWGERRGERVVFEETGCLLWGIAINVFFDTGG